MLLGSEVASDQNRCLGREGGNRQGSRRRKRDAIVAEQGRNDASHGGDAVKCQSLARLLGGLGLLLHHLHAIGVHLRCRRRGNGRPCSRRIGRLLAEEAKQGSEEEHDVKSTFHDRVALADLLQCYNQDHSRDRSRVPKLVPPSWRDSRTRSLCSFKVRTTDGCNVWLPQ